MFKFDFKRSLFSFSADTTLQAFDHSSSKTKLNQRIKDDALDIDAIPQYALSLEVGTDGFRCAIVDTEVNRCLWLEDYRFTSVFFPEQVVDQLNSIFDDHQLLHAGFWQKVRVSFKNQHFTLIPESLFKREYAEGYLRFSAESLKDTEEVIFYQHANREIVNVFAG